MSKSDKTKSHLLPDAVKALLMAVFLISAAVVFVLYFRPLYYLDIRLMNLSEASGRDETSIRQAYDAIIRYMYVWNRGELNLGWAMSERGRIHFADCKRIFDAVQILCAAAGMLTVYNLFVSRRRHDRVWLRAAGAVSIVLPCALGIAVCLSWERLFTVFHQLLFRNDYWLFDPNTDPIILVLPEGFFLECAIVIGVIILAGGLLCIRASRRR